MKEMLVDMRLQEALSGKVETISSPAKQSGFFSGIFVPVFHTRVIPVTNEREPPSRPVNMLMYHSQEMSGTLFPPFIIFSLF